jgi:2-C-methyl-D-erythritol 4-phosphate cytidylyltransferase/2-C-methyl-D-erythritol 2,4-cyclodiphosphate synthase
MYRDKRVAAVIAAAGAGSRMDADLPKQFMRIGGKSVLERAAEAFENNASVDDIYVVAAADRAADCRAALSGKVAKLRGVCAGGATRQESVFAGLSALPAAVDIVLIHDAARPFVSQGCIDRVLRLAAEKGAAAAGVPVKDTIKAARDGVFTETLDRGALYGMQTPQGFWCPLIRDAHAAAVKDGFTGTDDAVLLERTGKKVYLAEGEYDNIKLTTPEDVTAARAIATRLCGAQTGAQSALRVGNGYDVHRFGAGGRLILGGVDIPHGHGLLGHSDADALTHAIIDALLGAVSLGDIGGMFPDTEARYRGISSLVLLREAYAAVLSRGYALVNADATVAAERPRLAPYIGTMRERLADAMGTAPENISIKATTTEGLGFTGREEGVAALATVLLSGEKR